MENLELKKKKVSFSQYSMWMKCPYSWRLNYLEGKRIYDASLNIFFGCNLFSRFQVFFQKNSAILAMLLVVIIYLFKLSTNITKHKISMKTTIGR